MSKYAPLATSNASQFVDILLRVTRWATRWPGPDSFSGLPALRSPPAKPCPVAFLDSANGHRERGASVRASRAAPPDCRKL